MLRRDDLPVLQEVADYLSFRKRLRNFGLAGLIIGLLCLAVGFVAMILGWPRWLIFAAGLGFLLGASWALETPNAIRLGVLGVLLVAGGVCGSWALLWLIDTAIGVTAPQDPPSYAWVLIVPAMFIWGRWSIVFAVELGRKKYVKEPSPLEREVAAAVDGLLAADRDRSPDIIDLVVLRSLTIQQSWRGRLLDEMVIFVEGKGNQIIIAEKDDLDIALVSQKPVKDSYKIRLRCAERTIEHALMPAEAFEKYLTWKLA